MYKTLKARHPIATLVVVALCALGGAGCGGDAGIPGNAVAMVGETAITRASLDHWMSALFGGDYFEKLGRVAPRGLVSAPPKYSSCLAALRTMTATPAGSASSEAPLESKCQQLYQGVKQQAMTFLIVYQWAVGQAAEAGVKVTKAEVEREFKRVQAEHFPKEGELQQFLANHESTLSDELALMTRDVASTKLLTKLRKEGGEQALLRFLRKATKAWTAKTSCRPGYVVEMCKQYKANDQPTGPSPSILIEEIASLGR